MAIRVGALATFCSGDVRVGFGAGVPSCPGGERRPLPRHPLGGVSLQATGQASGCPPPPEHPAAARPRP
jgi:hypothetical protein